MFCHGKIIVTDKHKTRKLIENRRLDRAVVLNMWLAKLHLWNETGVKIRSSLEGSHGNFCKMNIPEEGWIIKMI